MYFQSYGGREFGIKVLRWLDPLAFFFWSYIYLHSTPPHTDSSQDHREDMLFVFYLRNCLWYSFIQYWTSTWPFINGIHMTIKFVVDINTHFIGIKTIFSLLVLCCKELMYVVWTLSRFWIVLLHLVWKLFQLQWASQKQHAWEHRPQNEYK